MGNLNPSVGSIATKATPDISFQQYFASQLGVQDIVVTDFPLGPWQLWGANFGIVNPIANTLYAMGIGEASDFDIVQVSAASPIPQTILPNPNPGPEPPPVQQPDNRYNLYLTKERPFSSPVLAPIGISSVPVMDPLFMRRSEVLAQVAQAGGFNIPFGDLKDEEYFIMPQLHLRIGYREDAVPSILGSYKRAPKLFSTSASASDFNPAPPPTSLINQTLGAVPIYGRNSIKVKVRVGTNVQYRVSYVTVPRSGVFIMEERPIYPASYPNLQAVGTGGSGFDMELEPRNESYLAIIGRKIDDAAPDSQTFASMTVTAEDA